MQIEFAVRDVGAIGRGRRGVIRIGLFSSVATGFLGALVKRFYDDHREVQLEFLEGDHLDLIPAVRRHQLDVAFLAEPSEIEDLGSLRLWTEQVYVVLSETDPLARRSEMTWDDLRRRRFIVMEAAPGRDIEALLIRNLSSIGYHPDIQRDPVSRQTLMQLVACGRGITLATESVIETQFAGVVYRRLTECSQSFYGIWSQENDNPPLRRLLSLANAMFKTQNHAGIQAIHMEPTLQE